MNMQRINDEELIAVSGGKMNGYNNKKCSTCGHFCVDKSGAGYCDWIDSKTSPDGYACGKYMSKMDA